MKSFKKIICALSIVTILGFTVAPAMALQPGDTVKAGFTDLPLREGQGTYCGVLKKLAIGQQLRVLSYDVVEGWSKVEVVGTGEKGFVCNKNTF